LIRLVFGAMLTPMKKLLCAFVVIAAALLFVAPQVSAQNYENALKTAKSENKPLLLYFYSKTCYFCGLMDKNTLSDNAIEAVIRRDFVYLRIDVDRSIDLARLYRIAGTPSSWFLEPSGKRLFEAPGYVEKSDYKTILEYVKGRYYDSMDLLAYMKKASSRR